MRLVYPVSNVILTQGFGENPAYYADEAQHPGWCWPGHNGLDFGGALGDPIFAAAIGTVTRAAYEEGGYGHYVRLTHDNGWLTYYAHLSRVDVSLNQRLSAGQVLGSMGDSGCAFGVHLHFGLRLLAGGPAGYDGYTDPSPYFSLPFREGPGLGSGLGVGQGSGLGSSLPEPTPSTGSGIGSGIGVISIPSQGRARVCVDVLNLRAAPDLSAAIVGALYAGALVAYDGVTVQEDVTWLAFAGLHAAAIYKSAQYVTVIG